MHTPPITSSDTSALPDPVTNAAGPPAGLNGADIPKAGREYLAFRVGHAEYGVDILQVQEIRTYEAPTALVHMPKGFLGVINLRGVLVPLIDLRLRLRHAQADCHAMTVVIVLSVHQRTMGAIVDSVCDVVSFRAEQLQAAPNLGTDVQPGHVTALGRIDQRTLILLDINKLLHGEETLPSPDLQH